jgi:diadenosine tetraphosphate (Ap4A) HIT family hydrolase
MPYKIPNHYPCPFCESAAYRLEHVRLLENKFAIAEISDCERSSNSGAMLIWPKAHVEHISQLSIEQAHDLVQLIFQASAGILVGVRPQGLHTFCSAGTLVGQSEAHMHFQIQPRYHDRPYSFAAAKDLPTIRISTRKLIASDIESNTNCQPKDLSVCEFMRFRDMQMLDRDGFADFYRDLVVTETENFIALCHPQSRGRGAVVVVSRRRALCFLVLSRHEREDLIILVRKIASAIENTLAPDGLSIWWDTGLEANQPGRDFVAEIVPRFETTPYTYIHREDMPFCDNEGLAETSHMYREYLSNSPINEYKTNVETLES